MHEITITGSVDLAHGLLFEYIAAFRIQDLFPSSGA